MHAKHKINHKQRQYNIFEQYRQTWGKLQLQKQEQLHTKWKMLNLNIYNTHITPNQPNFKEKIFIQTAKTNLTTTQNHSTSKIMKTRRNYWTIKCNHFTPRATWKKIRECALFNTTKIKCCLYLKEKLEIASYKGDNLLNKRWKIIISVDTKTSLPFYSMIGRTKSYIFLKIFLTVFQLKLPFSPVQLIFCIIWFSKQKSNSPKQRFHWRMLWVTKFLCLMNHFHWDFLPLDFHIFNLATWVLIINQGLIKFRINLINYITIWFRLHFLYVYSILDSLLL